MKHLIRSLLLLAALSVAAGAQSTNPIQRLPLNPLSVVRIPVALDRLTTVRFPSPVSDLDSASISTERDPRALFLLSFESGNAFFSLLALATNASTTLNVAWKGQTYVLELFESSNPWLSIVFDPPAAAGSGTNLRAAPPARLLGLLDTAKAFGLLQQQQPAAVAGVEVARPNTLHDYGDYTIRIEEVFRFDAEDTLVFRIGISNQTSALIQFVPESLMVRAGQRIYYQSITDATGRLPARTETSIYFSITGSADGSRNGLSPKNSFMVLLNRLEPAVSVATTPPAQPSAAASPTQNAVPAHRLFTPTPTPYPTAPYAAPAPVSAPHPTPAYASPSPTPTPHPTPVYAAPAPVAPPPIIYYAPPPPTYYYYSAPPVRGGRNSRTATRSSGIHISIGSHD